MSRNASGTYTLPTGNPVISGTDITVTWGNTTMDDIKTEMTDSLSRSGKGGMLAPLTFTDGTATSPGIAWVSDANSGFYRIGADNVGMSLGGVKVIDYANGAYSFVDTAATATVGPIFSIFRDSASPADADMIGELRFDGEDDGSVKTTYAALSGQIDDVTGATEDGTLLVKTMTAGTLTTQLDISSALVNITPATTIAGVLTTTAGITSGGSIISDTDSTDSIGSTGVRWLKGWFDTLTAGTLTIGAGSVTDSSGAISFGDENLTTTGNVDASGVEFNSLSGTGAVAITDIKDEDNMASDSATMLATQQSIKAYVDARVDTVDTLSEVLAIGNTTGATDIVVTAGQSITSDTIAETTAASGVTIDGVLAKDSTVKAGTLTVGAGSVTDSSGAITFGNENLVTTGTLGAGATTVTTFTSTGIDDNATSTQINISDTATTFGSDVTVGGNVLIINEAATSNSQIQMYNSNVIRRIIVSTFGVWRIERFNSSGEYQANDFSLSAAGDATFAGSLSKSSGSFNIPHPLPEKADTHRLVHSFVESPRAENLYSGMATLVEGTVSVNIDEHSGMTEGTFEVLNALLTHSSSNESGYTPVKCSMSGNTITITCQDETSTDTVYWEVRGERKDQHMLDTEWTDDEGHVIVEPEIVVESSDDV